MSTDLNVNFLGIRMKTPIIAASGTFGFGVEYKDYMDLSQIGAISCKGLLLRLGTVMKAFVSQKRHQEY